MKPITIKTLYVLALVSLAACRPGAPATTPTTEIKPAQPTLTAASTPQSPSPANTAWDTGCFGRPVQDCVLFRQGLIQAEQAALDRLQGASVYSIDLDIPDDFAVLTGHQQVLYTNQEDKPLDAVYFQLFPNIAGGKVTVSAVKVDGKEIAPVYEFKDSAVRVPLPEALQPGGQTMIQMDFRAEVPREMGGNYGLYGYFDEVLVLDEFYPVIPVYDDEGWNAKDPAPNGDVTYFDASFYLVRVTAPADLVVVASGIEVSREQDGDKQVLVLAAGPARDFYLAAGKFTLVSQTVGETTINSYALAEREQGAKLALQVTADALKSYSARFGAYPYTEMDVVSTPMLALGIEYPGIMGITLQEYDPDVIISGLPSQVMLESTVAHEVGHQWFYNVVGSDQIDEPWMDEAIVQYVTSLYYLDIYGEQAASSYRASWEGRWNRVERAEIPIGKPAAAYAGKEYSAIVYGRGPFFIAAMADKLGQDTFDKFMRDYYETHKWGIGTGDAFRQLAERHCNCDLTELFEEWVYEK